MTREEFFISVVKLAAGVGAGFAAYHAIDSDQLWLILLLWITFWILLDVYAALSQIQTELKELRLKYKYRSK